MEITIPTGFTTGSLYKENISLGGIISAYNEMGADAIELSFAKPEDIFSAGIICGLGEKVRRYSFVSVHAPWKKIRYGENSDSENVLSNLREICFTIPIKAITLHPDVVDDFDILEKSGLPFALENMDKRKNFGRFPSDFERLVKDYNFKFVIDLQHVFEADESMNVVGEFVGLYRNKLSHFHISGESQYYIHELVHKARNKNEIISALRNSPKVPRILESILREGFRKSGKEEIDFVRRI